MYNNYVCVTYATMHCTCICTCSEGKLRQSVMGMVHNRTLTIL